MLRFHLVFLTLLSLFCISLSVPVQLYNDPQFLDAEIRRIRAGKAGIGDPLNTPLRKAVVSSFEDGEESGDGSREDDEDYTSSEELDVTCAPGKGWHFRGQRCVIMNCPGGPDQRDFNTGECIHQVGQTQPRYKPYSLWNALNHVYGTHTHPHQRVLSRGMLAMMRRG